MAQLHNHSGRDHAQSDGTGMRTAQATAMQRGMFTRPLISVAPSLSASR